MTETEKKNKLAEAQTILAALAVETRLRLLVRLIPRELCVCELWPGIGEQSNISRHLARLRELGIVSMRKVGKRHLYRLADERVVRILRRFDLDGSEALPAVNGCQNCDSCD
ncbi:metalloregulator ArsR/SmtB family transcription factor [bacterium]|nr:metalloregulator ArsR/SmtB family transcription factor [bacterium]